MASIISSPSGVILPYPSLFNPSLRSQSTRVSESRNSDYFWKRGTSATIADNRTSLAESRGYSDDWLDVGAPALSDSEDESPRNPTRTRTIKPKKKNLRFTRIRQIAFKAFTPKSDGTSHKNNIVTTTEIIQKNTRLMILTRLGTIPQRTTIFNSWKFKSTGTKTQVKKMVAVLKERISASSPAENNQKLGMNIIEEIDVFNPPLPPMETGTEEGAPSAFTSRFYSAPVPVNEKARQLAVNRLGVLGGKAFDATDEGLAEWKGRVAAGDKLMQEGNAPNSLDSPWEPSATICSDGISEKSAIASGIQRVQSPPESLDQHPVLRKIVNECRQLFKTSICLLSVLDDDRQVFLGASGLAEVGLDEMRDIPKEISFCAHTILSGRKVLLYWISHKDGDLRTDHCAKFGVRFYAGVPLMAPNLDRSQRSEDNACPIGTLCILDFAPRENFSTDDRKRLVYLSEYARREIEKCQETWSNQLKVVSRSPIDVGMNDHQSEVLTDPRQILSPSRSERDALKSTWRHESTWWHESILESQDAKSVDLATSLIGQTTGWRFGWISSNIILSGYNIPAPVPVMDARLCLRALRAPQGGLLYQNPTAEESQKAGLQPQNYGPQSCASGMILAIGKEAYTNSGGSFSLPSVMSSILKAVLGWIKSLFFSTELEITIIGLQNSGKPTTISIDVERYCRGVTAIVFVVDSSDPKGSKHPN
ncbi:hypothetical protein H4Q26_017072 [Puccinia striiformis f. sp. tritici PST-130]|nr:hypothetical protein H4Q26_017072 [Puccinia striiformis f. sp. tritici PST-130]